MRLRRAIHGRGHNIVWIEQMVTKQEAIQLYSHCAVFCCPSVYEPFGIINLEAMACRAPVVACAVGGILEVVVEGETGHLVPFEPDPVTAFPVDGGAVCAGPGGAADGDAGGPGEVQADWGGGAEAGGGDFCVGGDCGADDGAVPEPWSAEVKAEQLGRVSGRGGLR